MPLIEHLSRLLAEAGAAKLVVSGRYPAYAGVQDQVPGLGPLGGLMSVADTLPNGDLLIVPVDMPRLAPARLRQLMSACGPCLTFEGQVLPMRLRLDAVSRAALRRLATAPPPLRSLRALQQALGVLQLPLLPEHVPEFDNCNTPLQWLAMRP